MKQNWDAEDYARNSSAQMEWAHELIAKLSLQDGESVLDIGCGDGRITAELAGTTTGRVLGIDLSPDMIRTAAMKYPAARHPNLSFLQMDAATIRYAEKFDVAFSSAVLHWVEDHPAVLQGTRGCLDAGGRLLFQMGGRGNAGEMFCAMQEVMRRSCWRTYYREMVSPYHLYGPEEYRTWLPACGFRPQRIELIPKEMRHEGRDALKGWLRTTWFPYTDRLPVTLRDGFLDEVVEEYTGTHPADARGDAYVRMVRLEVEAIAI